VKGAQDSVAERRGREKRLKVTRQSCNEKKKTSLKMRIKQRGKKKRYSETGVGKPGKREVLYL